MSINKKNKIGRNDLCPCKSGMKYKHCHGDQVKMMQCKTAANVRMLELIQEEKIRRGIVTVEITDDPDPGKAAYDKAAEKMRKKSDVTARLIG